MESRTVDPDEFAPDELGVSDALREAVEEEMEFLDSRGLRLIRLRENDDGDVTQVTVQAGDEMYRLSEVSPGNVSRTVFRNPAPDEEDAEADEEAEEDGDGEEAGGAEKAEEDEESEGDAEDSDDESDEG